MSQKPPPKQFVKTPIQGTKFNGVKYALGYDTCVTRNSTSVTPPMTQMTRMTANL